MIGVPTLSQKRKMTLLLAERVIELQAQRIYPGSFRPEMQTTRLWSSCEHHRLLFSNIDDDDEVMLNVLKCQLSY